MTNSPALRPGKDGLAAGKTTDLSYFQPYGPHGMS